MEYHYQAPVLARRSLTIVAGPAAVADPATSQRYALTAVETRRKNVLNVVDATLYKVLELDRVPLELSNSDCSHS